MFIIETVYIKEMSEVNKFHKAHLDFLDEQFAKGTFIVSGPKNPRDGGIILVKTMDRKELDSILAQDPFYSETISQFKITEFLDTKKSANFNY